MNKKQLRSLIQEELRKVKMEEGLSSWLYLEKVPFGPKRAQSENSDVQRLYDKLYQGEDLAMRASYVHKKELSTVDQQGLVKVLQTIYAAFMTGNPRDTKHNGEVFK